MIHLDTNLLIYLADGDPKVSNWIGSRISDGVKFHVSSITWYEFLAGPVTLTKIVKIQNLVKSSPLPFDTGLAEKSAEFFNATGRSRKRKTDTMIAATAILHGGKLATRNIGDFQCFEPLGLELIEV